MAYHADTGTVHLSQEQGTLSYLDAGGEQTIAELTDGRARVIHSLWLDLSNMTQDGDIALYAKVDGSNYRKFHTHAFTVATDPDGVHLQGPFGIDHDVKLTYTEGADEGAARDLPYTIVYEQR